MGSIKAKVLTWKSMRGYERVRKDDIKDYLDLFQEEELPATKKGRVRWFISLANDEGLNVRLRRYFDTWDYQKFQGMCREAEEINGL